MFTGLITHVGDVTHVAETPEGGGRALTIAAPWADVADGESIAVDGVCLTVTRHARGEFSVAAVGTTLARTTIGTWRTGRRVNLERALRAGDRLGGHIVQGHVDGVAAVTAAYADGDAWILELALWDGAEGLCVPQGSITVDGVSLTVHTLPTALQCGVSIVDYTRRHTTLGAHRVGDHVHVELDVIGKYIRQMVGPWSATGVSAGLR